MTENSDRPREFDAVLGGEKPAPTAGAVLGGIAGVRKRLASDTVEYRIAAIKDAIKYGKSGLEIVIEALRDESDDVQRSAYLLLRERTEPEVRNALRSFNFYRFFDCLRTLKGGTQIAIGPNGETAATLVNGKAIKVWNIQTGEVLYSIAKYPKYQQFFRIDSDGKFLIRSIQGSSNFVEVWDEGELQYKLHGHEDKIGAIAISPDKQILATGSNDKSIKVWDLETGKLMFTIDNFLTWGAHTGAIVSLVFSQDGQTLVSSSNDGTTKSWNLRNRDKIRTFKSPYTCFFSLVMSPNGQIVAGACWDRKIRLMDLGTGEFIRTLEGHSGTVNCLSFSPDGKTLASSGSYDKTIKFWNLQTEEYTEVVAHEISVNCLAFSWDGQTLISGSEDKTIKVWGIQ